MNWLPWIIGGAILGGLAVTATVATTNVLWSIPPFYLLRAEPYTEAFAAAESAYGLPAGLLSRVAYQESRFLADAISPVGAVGLMQFMPGTAHDFGIDPRDPFQSINAAGRYLSQLFHQFGNWSEAIAAYNWGPGNVARHGLDQAPDETRQYYVSITSDLGLA